MQALVTYLIEYHLFKDLRAKQIKLTPELNFHENKMETEIIKIFVTKLIIKATKPQTIVFVAIKV